jgi:hypothetical protein
VDAFLGGPAEDWTAAYVEQAREAEKRAAERVAKQEALRNKTSKPSLALSAYAGAYDCSLIGPATVSADGAGLRIALDKSDAGAGEAEHWQYDTFLIRWKDPTVVRAFITFELAPDGKVLGFRMEQAEEGDPSFDFENLEYKRTDNPRIQ